MRVLISNITLAGRSGTEICTRDLALELINAGHQPTVYSPSLGPIAEELRHKSIPVSDDIAKIEDNFDLLHCHHTPTAATAIARFPGTPAVFVCHSFAYWFDVPPQLPSIRRCVAVDETVADRLVSECGVERNAVRVILNSADMERFRVGPELSHAPKRALAFAKNLGHIDPIREACEIRGIKLDVVGHAVGHVLSKPEDAINRYDVIFASALTAIEALSCGRAVIVCDGRGLAGLVDMQNYPRWRKANFGLRVLDRSLTAEAIGNELDRYSRDDAAAVSKLIRVEADSKRWLQSWLDLYRMVLDEKPPDVSEKALSVSLSRHLQIWSPSVSAAWPWMSERERLIREINQIRSGQSIRLKERFIFSRRGSRTGLLYGFHEPEEWGVWTSDEEACLSLSVSADPNLSMKVCLEVVPFLHPSHKDIQVDIFLDGKPIGRWNFEYVTAQAGEIEAIDFLLDPTACEGRRQFTFRFLIRSPASPLELGISDDPRRLGLGLVAISFLPGQGDT